MLHRRMEVYIHTLVLSEAYYMHRPIIKDMAAAAVLLRSRVITLIQTLCLHGPTVFYPSYKGHFSTYSQMLLALDSRGGERGKKLREISNNFPSVETSQSTAASTRNEAAE